LHVRDGHLDLDVCQSSGEDPEARVNLSSRARYTSPIPPAPSGESNSYGPNRLPDEIVISIHESQITDCLASVIFRRRTETR